MQCLPLEREMKFNTTWSTIITDKKFVEKEHNVSFRLMQDAWRTEPVWRSKTESSPALMKCLPLPPHVNQINSKRLNFQQPTHCAPSSAPFMFPGTVYSNISLVLLLATRIYRNICSFNVTALFQRTKEAEQTIFENIITSSISV